MNTVLRFASRASLVAGGLVLVVTAAQTHFSRQLGQLVTQGAFPLPAGAAQPESVAMLLTVPLHGAAVASNDAGTALVLGVLLLILGFGFHVWYILRSPRRVAVHAV